MAEDRGSVNGGTRCRVAIVYHFFQHYRQGILDELSRSATLDVEFLADQRDVYGSGVEVWAPGSHATFTEAPCRVIGGMWVWQSGLQRLALRRDIDCVIFLGNPYFLATWMSAFLCRLRGKRVLFWTHGWLRSERGLKRIVRSLFYRLAHGLLVYGQGAKKIAVEAGFDADTIHVIFNSLNYEEQRQARDNAVSTDLADLRSELFDLPERPIVICSSRLVERRRLDLLMKAAAILEAEGHPINLLIVGDGPQRAELEDLGRSLSLALHWFGACYDLDLLARLYAISAVTVSPGMVGLTAVQSMGFGVPVITHDSADNQMPEAEAVIRGETGDLYRFGDVADLASTIRRWTTRLLPDAATREASIRLIEQNFNPRRQLELIEGAINGLPPPSGPPAITGHGSPQSEL